MLTYKFKNISLLLVIFCLLLSCACVADEINEYPCYRMINEPILDGKPDNVWSTIPMTEGFVNLNTVRYSSKQTAFKMGYDDTALYIFIRCEEPDMDRIVDKGGNMEALWSDDSVEIFFQPRDDTYYQFIINSRGSRWNGNYVQGKNRTRELGDWNAVVYKGDNFWSVEAKIPFAILDSGAEGEWRGNIARNIRTTGESSTWSKLKGGFHDLVNFGAIVFMDKTLTVNEAKAMEKNLNQVVPNIIDKGELYVGWSEVSITPDKPVKLQGQFYERISQYVQSEIVVTVLALETRDPSGKTIEQLMIGACDLCNVSAELLAEVREKLQGRLPGFSLDKLFLSATHTHTAPFKAADEVSGGVVYQYIPDHMKPLGGSEAEGIMQPGEYGDFLVERLCDAFISAWENRKPGLVNWQLAHAVVGHNRRLVYDDGSAQMYGSSDAVNFDCIEGPADHGIELLYFWDQAEKLTGVAVNVACPSQVVENQYFISADYWETVRTELKKRFSDDLFILPLCGAAGDQSPRDLIRRGRGEPSMNSVEGAVELGKRIADAVTSKYEASAGNKKANLEFCHVVVNLDLPVRTVTREEYEVAKAKLEAVLSAKKSGERLSTGEISGLLFEPAGIMDRYESQQYTSFYTPEIHIIRLGSIAIASNPFELFTDYGLRIKARSQAQQTFIVQLACDKGRYLPTKKAVAGGGYSAIIASGIVGPEGGRVLVEQTVKLINNLFSPYLDSTITQNTF